MRGLKLMVSVAFVLMTMISVGATTFAYFTDVETATGNTFNTGTLNLVLTDDDETDQDGVTLTWEASDWKPGDPEVVAELTMKNIGTIGADLVSIRGDNLVESDNSFNEPEGPGSLNNIADHIYVTTIQYTELGGYLYGNLATWYATSYGAAGTYLTLKEFCQSPYSMVFWIGGWPPPQVYLPASGGRVEKLKLGFTFDSGAGNDYQSDSATFTITVTAVQSYTQVTLLGKGPGACYGYVD